MKIRLFTLALAGLLGAVLFFVSPVADANLSSYYGYQLNSAKYRTSLPISARIVYVGRERLYLAEGIYYRPYMVNGRTVYVPVDTTFQRR